MAIHTIGGNAAFEIIWDILLSYYVIRGAFHYSALTFFCSLPLAGSSLVLSYPIFDLTQLQQETAILVIFTFIVIVCAQYSMGVHKVPQQIGFRLSIGLLGTAFLLGGELAVWTALYRRGSIWGEWYRQSSATTIGILGAMTALVTFMPSLLMLVGESDRMLFDESPDVSEDETKKS